MLCFHCNWPLVRKTRTADTSLASFLVLLERLLNFLTHLEYLSYLRRQRTIPSSHLHTPHIEPIVADPLVLIAFLSRHGFHVVQCVVFHG